MKRRKLLAGMCGVGVLSGCVSTVESAINSDSGPIENQEFEAFDSGTDFYESIYPLTRPDVRFRRDDKDVEIVGILCVGSPDMYRASLEKSEFHPDTKTLIVHVGREEIQSAGNALMGSNAYRATISFKQELPHWVVAVQLGQCDVRTTTTHPPIDE